jgi:hypothetical protein
MLAAELILKLKHIWSLHLGQLRKRRESIIYRSIYVFIEIVGKDSHHFNSINEQHSFFLKFLSSLEESLV